MIALAHPRRRERTWVDGFCGLGGSSEGISRNPGVEIVAGMNHWDEAIHNYRTRHTQAQTYQVDLSSSDPAWFPSTQFAWFSPECDGNSRANSVRGKKENAYQMHMFDTRKNDPAVERSRMTAWDVVYLAWYHDYDAIIVENVVDFTDPFVFADYPEWLRRLHRLGYKTKEVYLNAQFLGVPQSRDRVYVICWNPDRARCDPDLDIRPRAHCERCGQDVDAVQHWKNPRITRGVYGRNGQYIYICPNHPPTRIVEVFPYTTAAWTIIDWDVPAQPIGERKRPLAEKTLNRIRKGLRRFGYQAQLVDLARSHGTNVRSRPVTEPVFTQTSAHTTALLAPLIVNLSYADGGSKVWPSSYPLPTQTTRQNLGVAMPPGTFLVTARNQPAVADLNQPPHTIAAGSPHAGQIMPPPGAFLVKMRGTSSIADVEHPFPTFTAGGGHHIGVAVPFIAPYNGTDNAVEVTRPLPTATTVERHGLVVPADGYPSEPTDEAIEAMLNACGFRMLQPETEIAAAMDLAGYPLTARTKRSKVIMLGNAVVARKAEILAARLMAVFS